MVPKIKKDEGLAHKDAMSRAGELWGKLTEEEKSLTTNFMTKMSPGIVNSY